MPARRDAHPAGYPDAGAGRAVAGPARTPDRAARARLRHRSRRRGECRTRREDAMNPPTTPGQSKTRRRLPRADILPLDEYAKIRRQRRAEISEVKKWRGVGIGPFATFYFENFDTMWQQVQEMLYIEKGGEAQIEDELAAYNPLIPQGAELVATVMIEIEDAARRGRELAQLGGIENHAFVEVGGNR